MKYLKIALVLTLLVTVVGCTQQQNKPSFKKSPIDMLIRDMNKIESFVIILYDMDYNESNDAYMHQYQLLIDNPGGKDTIQEKITDWYTVSAELFMKHQEDMGMEVASKSNGKVTKQVSPAGYSNYVGNEKYGQWKERDGGSFWEFYGKYMFLSSMFRMATYPVGYGYYNDYRRNYWGTGNAYYGYNGQRTYGTNSDYNRSNKNTKWNNKSSSFKQNVRSRVSQSSMKSKTRTRSKTRTSRSNSRYNNTRSRSRSGGFGK